MKKHLARIIGMTLLAVAATACAADSKIEDVLKARFPRLTFDSVSPSPVKGLYEVVSGNNVFYFDPTSGHVIFGEMWSPKGISVSAAARSKIDDSKYANFKKHLADAVKIGNGPNEVIEISDPDCPFCRKMNAYWSNRSDVTRYVFLLPLTQLHPSAKAHAEYILSSVDPAKALNEVESGKFDNSALPTVKLNAERIKTQMAMASSSGINGTPAFYINGFFVNGANIPIIEQHLKIKE